MKKRILCMILMVCMIVSLLVGFTVSAAAEAGIVTYTLKDGDTVLKACQKNGIDFYAKQKLIAAINNITDYRSLPVGFKVKLPTDEYVASASAIAATSASTVSTAAAISAGDAVSYYLIRYTMRSGDTVAGVCNNLGVNFSTYSSMIKDLNGINNWNNVAAGKSILIPSTVTPAVGTACYAVVAHTVASGETASSICSSHGINYGSNEALLKALNNKSNLNNIAKGSTFLVPVATTITGTGVTSGTAVAPTTTTSSSTGTVNSNDTKYSMTIKKDSGITAELLVNNKSATVASAGETVTIKYTNSNTAKKIGSVTVVKSNGDSVAVSNNKFTMPASDVTVRITLIGNKSYDIIDKTDKNTGTIKITVNGSVVTKANDGQTVKVAATPKKGYELKAIYWDTNEDFSTQKVLADDGKFAMPEAKVFIKAVFTLQAEHAITLKTGSAAAKFLVGGENVTKTLAGYTVKVVPTEVPGQKVKSITAYKTDIPSSYITVTDDSFIMPTADVTVNVTLEAVKYNISLASSPVNGTVSFTVDGNAATSAEVDKDVKVVTTPASGYKFDKITVTGKTADGTTVDSSKITVSGNTFKVDSSVTDIAEAIVTVSFVRDTTTRTITASIKDSTINGAVSRFDVQINDVSKATFDSANTTTTAVSAVTGDKISIIATFDPNYTYTAKYSAGEIEQTVEFNKAFSMPASDIALEITEIPNSKTVSSTSLSNVSMQFSDTDQGPANTVSADIGETVTIIMTPKSEEYVLRTGSLIVKDPNGKNVNDQITLTQDSTDENKYTFFMPAYSVKVSATFDKVKYAIQGTVGKLASTYVDGTAVSNFKFSANNKTYSTVPGNVYVRFGDKVYVDIGIAWDQVGSAYCVDTVGNRYTLNHSSGSIYWYSFNDPEITPQVQDLEINLKHNLVITNDSKVALTVYSNGAQVYNTNTTKTIQIPYGASVAFTKTGVNYSGVTATASENTYDFTMPAADVTLVITPAP